MTEKTKQLLQQLRERLEKMKTPQMAYGGGALSGALLVFLLNSQSEGDKQQTEILHALTSQSEQITLVLENQDHLRGELQVQLKRLEALEREDEKISHRQDRLEREQREAETGQIKLRAEFGDWIRKQVSYTADGNKTYSLVNVVAKAIIAMEQEGATDVWTERGAPYADTAVLSRRLGVHISADIRDQAAALLTMARSIE